MAPPRAPNLRPTRQDTHLIHLTLDHPVTGATIQLGTWDKKTGGAVDSEDTKYYPGGMADPVSLGGRRTVDNLTFQRLMRIERDWGIIQLLVDAVGRSRMTASMNPLNADGSDAGVPALTYNGTLKRVAVPDIDSEASGPALIEVEMIVESFPTSA